ncbi:MAG: fumarylacetoacetate hydrolase family protein, partial [Chloroflexota bacterium]
MRFCTFRQDGITRAGIVKPEGILPLGATNIKEVIEMFTLNELQGLAANTTTNLIDPQTVTYAAPYHNPSKLWGIGLNYQDHAADLDEVSPNEEPASFMKPITTIINPGDNIVLP